MEIYSKTTTIGEAVDNFFDVPLWKSLEAKDGTKYVRVSGISYTEPYEGKIAITFELTETGFELFGATQNDNILEKVECPLVMEMIYSLENKVR